MPGGFDQDEGLTERAKQSKAMDHATRVSSYQSTRVIFNNRFSPDRAIEIVNATVAILFFRSNVAVNGDGNQQASGELPHATPQFLTNYPNPLILHLALRC